MPKISNLDLLKKIENHDSQLFLINKRLSNLEDRTELLPRLYDNVDFLVSEVKEKLEDNVIISNTLENHEERIAKLEKSS